MSAFLLDVNLLIALAWPTHVHHRTARDWFRQNKASGWATCPLTECGFVRISSNAKIMNDAVAPRAAVDYLMQLQSQGNHHFWTDSIPLTDASMNTSLIMGHRQVTDAYLLNLAIHNGGTLATLDRGIANLLPTDHPCQQALCIIRLKDQSGL